MTGTKNSVVTGAEQAADDGTPERRVLLAALAHAERHRQHADDHRQRRQRITGRSRVMPDASGAAAVASRSCWRCSLANVTSRMLLAVATPMHMIAPISAGTLRVVLREEEHPGDAGERARQRHEDDEGVEPRLEVDHHEQVDEEHREHDAGGQAAEARLHALHLPLDAHHRAARQTRLDVGDHLTDARSRSSRGLRPSTLTWTSYVRGGVEVRSRWPGRVRREMAAMLGEELRRRRRGRPRGASSRARGSSPFVVLRRLHRDRGTGRSTCVSSQ